VGGGWVFVLSRGCLRGDEGGGGGVLGLWLGSPRRCLGPWRGGGCGWRWGGVGVVRLCVFWFLRVWPSGVRTQTPASKK